MSYKIKEQPFLNGDPQQTLNKDGMRVDYFEDYKEYDDEETAFQAARELAKECLQGEEEFAREQGIDGELMSSEWEEDYQLIIEIARELGKDNYGVDDYETVHRIIVEIPRQYEIIEDWLGAWDLPATEDDFGYIIKFAQEGNEEDFEDWKLYIEVSGDELRLYAELENDESDVEPSLIRYWQQITYEIRYTVIGRLIER